MLGESDLLESESLTDLQNEIVLLRSEHYLHLNTSKNVNEFHIRFSFPPDYNYQTPIFLEIYNDTTADLVNYKIENDKNEPNKIVNFTIGSLEKKTVKMREINSYIQKGASLYLKRQAKMLFIVSAILFIPVGDF